MPEAGPVCPACGSPSKLVGLDAVYGPKYAGRGNAWACERYPECDTYVRAVDGGAFPFPAGTMAGRRLRGLRMHVQRALAGLRLSLPKQRSRIAQILRRRPGDISVSRLNEDECLAILRVLAPENMTAAGAKEWVL